MKPIVEKLRQVTTEITEVKFGADESLLAKMNRVKGLIAHRKPGLKISELIDELCEIALNELDPQRKGTNERPEKKVKMLKTIPPTLKVKTPVRKYIPVKTKKEIWLNANGKCQNCRSEYALEIDHQQPVSLGGSSEINNLRLLCRNCNQREAVTKLGGELMQGYIN